jgi:hypothetical protein
MLLKLVAMLEASLRANLELSLGQRRLRRRCRNDRRWRRGGNLRGLRRCGGCLVLRCFRLLLSGLQCPVTLRQIRLDLSQFSLQRLDLLLDRLDLGIGLGGGGPD